ncbi:PDZ domain-containing protein [Arenimonas fontis]|uniref:PDZ domain-containing protein n=1 Tax=Arenimonas fontis TaxID=2608255 RepID=A0A5B2ZDN0_9GAMM|nr:PDZ domain-containing protein [Arenimonas fontis]KAA2286137.1 PDZ domain-containing protein [Arenimonas fontis]
MRVHRTVAAGLVALLLGMAPGAALPAQDESAPAATGDAERMAAARDRVLPVVVSILTVREDFQQGEPVLTVSSGSGTVVTAEGHVATNAHVTQNGRSFRVVFADGRELPAQLVGEDSLSDLAVLKVQPPAPETFAHAEFAERLDLRPGDTVLAMGAPWGLSNSLSAGVVNNPRRLLVSLFDDEADYEDRLGADQPTGRYYAWIQHDAAIAPGNSGGPLVDLHGRIVGVNTRGMIFGGDLAFAIPGPDAAVVVRELIGKGRIERAHLGFRLRSLKGTGFERGVLVNAVERGSEAEQAGLRPGDRILGLDGDRVDAPQPVDVPALQRRIAELPIGHRVRLDIERKGRRERLLLTALAQPPDRGEERAFLPFGASLVELTPAMSRRRQLDTESGLLVTGVRPGGPAAIARPALQSGDVIRAVDGRPVASHADLEAFAVPGPGRSLVVEFHRGAERRLTALVPVYGDRVRTPLPELPKAWAGVEVQAVTGSLARELGLPGPGYRVTRIYPGSPLGQAGARVGDLLNALEGQPLLPANDNNADGFHQRVRELPIGHRARFLALREGRERHLEADLAAAPADASALRTLSQSLLRAQLRELGFYDRVARQLPATQAGVLVDGVESGGPAGLAHLKTGDLIVHLGDQPVRDLDGLAAALDAALGEGNGRVIPLQVIRGAETRILYLERYWLTETR